jgi:hypothetical protein
MLYHVIIIMDILYCLFSVICLSIFPIDEHNLVSYVSIYILFLLGMFTCVLLHTDIIYHFEEEDYLMIKNSLYRLECFTISMIFLYVYLCFVLSNLFNIFLFSSITFYFFLVLVNGYIHFLIDYYSV